MKELPILFSTPMVQAIDENRKKMTRRTRGLEKVNGTPDEYMPIGMFHNPNNSQLMQFDHLEDGFVYCKPHYQVGDHIWIKETYFDTKPFKQYPLFINTTEYIYRADKDKNNFIGEHKWKPSLFMPKVAARIWVEVTGVRCERLQDINVHDSINEGIERIQVSTPFEGYKDYFIKDLTIGIKPIDSFFSLWMKINGIESLQLNPWVFVYEFKKIENHE